jgi:hypothetical protein
MSYSLDKHPNAPYEFPPPPPFLVWTQSYKYDYTTRTHTKLNEGQVRHIADLSKAKTRVRQYCKPHRYWNPLGNEDEFHTDWAVYHWNAEKGEYELQYEGRTGEKIATNPLFATRLTKGEKHKPRPGLEAEVEQALASIASAL